jgi:hypothetical protein
MFKRAAFSLVLCLIFITTGLTYATVNDSIIQVFTGRDARFAPDTMDGPLLVKKFSKWVYVITSDWEQEFSDYILQFEITPADTLKYLKAVPLPGNGASYFISKAYVLTLPSGDGMVYMCNDFNAYRGQSTEIEQWTIDKTTGDWTSTATTTIASGGSMIMSPDHKFLYTVGGPNPNSPVFGFAIDAITGTLSAITSAYSPLMYSYMPRITADGNFFYASGMDSATGYNGSYAIARFSRDKTTGLLTYIDSLRTPAAAGYTWNGMGMTLTPGDRKMVTWSGSSNLLVYYNRNASTGALALDTMKPTGASCITTNVVFPDDHTSYWYGDNHCDGGLWKADWDAATDRAGDFATIYHISQEGIMSMEYNAETDVYYGVGFYHDTELSSFIVVKRKNASTPVFGSDENSDVLAGLSVRPHPFNPSTTLSYSLLHAGKVTLNVYDLSGKKLSTPVDGLQDAGTHQVKFNAGGLPSGVYVCKLTAGSRVSTRTLMLIK